MSAVDDDTAQGDAVQRDTVQGDTAAFENAGTQPVSDVSLADIAAEQSQLRQDFEKLAAAVTPLLTKQFRETEARVRALEMRLRARQERPLVMRLANLLHDARRITGGEDLKEHVVEALTDALTSFGYQEYGEVGDQYSPEWFDAIDGVAGGASVVSIVHTRGLACYGDVLIKSRVTIAPEPSSTTSTEKS